MGLALLIEKRHACHVVDSLVTRFALGDINGSEQNVSERRLPTNHSASKGNSPISLGAIFGGQQILDLEFEFHLAGSPLAGDFDVNGDVDGLDFLAWQQDPNVGLLSNWETNYGTTGSGLGGRRFRRMILSARGVR